MTHQPRVTVKLGAVTVPRPDERREPDDHRPAGEDPREPSVSEMFEFLSHQMNEISVSVAAGRTETAGLRSEVMPHIVRLNRRVFGSKPPPLERPSVAIGELAIPVHSAPPLSAVVVTQHESIELLQQEMSNLREDVQKRDDARKRELGQQSRVMGLSPLDDLAPDESPSPARKARAYVGSRAFVKDLLLLVAAIAGLVGTIRGTHVSSPAALPALSAPSGAR